MYEPRQTFILEDIFLELTLLQNLKKACLKLERFVYLEVIKKKWKKKSLSEIQIPLLHKLLLTFNSVTPKAP